MHFTIIHLACSRASLTKRENPEGTDHGVHLEGVRQSFMAIHP